jgi:hypothetical protein
MQIKYNNPSLTPGMEVAVHCLGILVNGESVEIGEEELAAFAVEKGMPLEDALATIPFTEQYASKMVSSAPPAPPVENVEGSPEKTEGGE